MRYILTGFICILAVLSRSQETLTLDAIVANVLESNFDIRLERNNVTIADNNNNIGNTGYLPTIGVTADQNWSLNNTRQQFFSGQVNEASGAKNMSTNAAVRLNWTFFDGFKMFATDQRLQLQEDVATLQLTAEMEMRIYQAAVLYYTILQQQEFTPVYEQAFELSKARYALTDLRVQKGAGTQLQLIQARLDLTEDSSVLLQHAKLLSDLKIDLNTVMGLSDSVDFNVSGSVVPETLLIWESVIQQAKNQNTQLLLAKSAIAITEIQRKEVQSFYYPQLSFYTQYAYATSQNQIGILNSSRSYGVGAGFTFKWTILDRLSTYNSLKNNKINLDNALIIEEKQNQFIEAELRKTFNEYEWAKENLNLEQTNILNAEEIFSIAEQSFKNGSLTSLELREIQFSVIEAKSRLLSAQLALKTAELNISLTTGNFQKMLQ